MGPARGNPHEQLEAMERIKALLEDAKRIAEGARLEEWAAGVFEHTVLPRADQEIADLKREIDRRS